MGAVVTDVLETRLELTNLGGYKAALGAAGSAVDFFGGRLDASTRRTVAAGAAAAGAAVGYGLLARAVGEAGRRQQLEIGLRTVLGSAEAAKAKLEELQRFAAGSPFDFAESARGAQQLLAMGVAADDLIPIMTAAGNASAAAGGDVQTFLRSLRAIGQIKTKGTLGLEELLQLTEAGIPAIEILREELGLSADQMKNISAQGIEAGKAIDALTRGMNKRFGGAMSEQMKSLEGSFSNLRDASNEALAALGAPVAPWVTGVANTVRGAVDAFNQLPEVIKSGAAVALVAGTVGFAHYAGKVALSSLKAQELAGENADLLNSTLKTSKAADSLGDEEDETGRQMGAAGDYASGLTGKLWPLAAAHDAAAAAAHRHADAEQRMGRASPRVESSGTVAGGTQRGPTGKRSPRAASGDAQPSGATQPAGGKATAPKKGRFKLPKLSGGLRTAADVALMFGTELAYERFLNPGGAAESAGAAGDLQPSGATSAPEGVAANSSQEPNADPTAKPQRAPMLRRENMGKNWAADLSADVGAKLKVTSANLGRRAVEGAMLGSRFGLPGAALGGAAGLGFGAVENLVNLNNGTVSKQVYGDPAEEANGKAGGGTPEQQRIRFLEAQLAEAQKTNELLRDIRDNGAVSFQEVPRAYQLQALAANARGLA